jgi:hypothetical protein
MSEKALRAMKCLEYHVKNNLWCAQFGAFHGEGEPLGGCWRLACAPCLGDATVDVRGGTMESCLEAAFDSFDPSFVSEAESR